MLKYIHTQLWVWLIPAGRRYRQRQYDRQRRFPRMLTRYIQAYGISEGTFRAKQAILHHTQMDSAWKYPQEYKDEPEY